MKLAFLFAIVLGVALGIVYWQWDQPSHIIALGSILGASISSLALAYNVIVQNKSSRKEAKLSFINFLPNSKRVLNIDIERAMSACPGTQHFLELHKKALTNPDQFISLVTNDETVCGLLKSEFDDDNLVLRAALDTFKERYDNLKTEATMFNADFYFEVSIGELGYDAFYRLFWDL